MKYLYLLFILFITNTGFAQVHGKTAFSSFVFNTKGRVVNSFKKISKEITFNKSDKKFNQNALAMGFKHSRQAEYNFNNLVMFRREESSSISIPNIDKLKFTLSDIHLSFGLDIFRSFTGYMRGKNISLLNHSNKYNGNSATL